MRCLFLEDRWCSDYTLKECLQLFALALEPLAVAARCFMQRLQGENGHPLLEDTCVMRRPRLLGEMLSLLQQCNLDISNSDEWRWRWGREGCFSVKSAYQVLTDGGMCFSLLRQIWQPKSLLKVEVLIWRIAHGRLLTCDRLSTLMEGIPTLFCL